MARQLQAITRTELGRQAGLSAAAISQYEGGKTRPRPAAFAQLALALNVPTEFLTEGQQDLAMPQVSDSFFRSLRRTTLRDRERATANAGLLAQLVNRVEQSVELPPLSVPDLTLDPAAGPEAAEDAATAVRDAWNVPVGPVPHVLRLLERNGIVVARLPLVTRDVDAFSWTEGPRPLVMLGSDKGVYERSRLDAAHELAHIVLHHADPEPANPAMERQAHRFAAAFLVPAHSFRKEWPSGRLDWSLVQRLRQRWGVSMGALVYRAKDLGLLSPTAYENAMRYMSRCGWRTHEPPPHRSPEEPALLAEAISLLAQHGITLEQIASEARLTSADDLTKRFRISAEPQLKVVI